MKKLPDKLIINGIEEPESDIACALEAIQRHKNEVLKVVRSYVNGFFKLYIETT